MFSSSPTRGVLMPFEMWAAVLLLHVAGRSIGDVHCISMEISLELNILTTDVAIPGGVFPGT